jgi:hypothetical protein
MLPWKLPTCWLRVLDAGRPSGTPNARHGRSRKLTLELLEDRTLPSINFAPAVSYPVGSFPNGVVTGDFNGDGKVDLAVANAPSTVGVLLGNGDGTFQSQQTFATGSGAVNVAVGDFNGDGKLDLVVADFTSNTVSVLLGNGDGTFQSQRTFATGSNPNSVAVGDFNGDGKLDLATANNGSANVSVLLGNGDGTFQSQQTFATGTNSASVAVADFNGDGKLDLAVGNYGNNISVLLGNGDGTFQNQQTFLTGSGPYLAVGDFNGDGKPDLAVDNFNNNNVGVLLGNGDGTFQSQQTFATGSSPLLLTTGDFNGDGKPDLAVSNIHGNTVGVLLGNGDGTFQSQQAFTTGTFPDSVAAGDFNGDGRLDLATANEGSNSISILLTLRPTVTVVDAGGTYNGSPFPATGSNVSADGSTAVSGSYTFTYTNTADGSTSSGAPVNAGSYTVVAHFTSSDPNYSNANSGPTSFTISPAPLSGSITAANKVYDGTAAATITSRTLTGVVPADSGNVSYVGGTATFADPTVGTGKTVTATGLSLSGPAAGNYSVNTTASTTADITAPVVNVQPTASITGPASGVTGQSLTFTVGATDPSPSLDAAGFTYTITWGDGSTPTTVAATPGNGSGVAVSHAFPAGPYTVHVSAADQSDNTGTASLDVTISRAGTGTTLAVSALTPLAGMDTVDLTASVAVNAPGSGTFTGSVDFVDTTTGMDLGSAVVVNGVATLHTGPFTAGTHALTATYSGDTNFLGSSGTASLTALAPASLSGTVFADFNNDGQVDFGEKGISGVSIILAGTDDLGHGVNFSQTTDGDGAYVFPNLRPGTYYLTEASQPSGFTEGTDSVGTAGGQLSAIDQFFVQLTQGIDGLNYNYGERPAATGAIQPGQTAGIGFWNNKHGQALILAFNGGTGHQLGDWLAATLVNLYGANSANNLAGKSNSYIAALFQQDFLQKGQKLDAQVLATALSVYATNATLDDTQVAAQYGFTVSGDGVGTATVNVGSNGDAFGVANGTTMTVIDLLLAADAQAVSGVLYNGNATLRNKANNVFGAVN